MSSNHLSRDADSDGVSAFHNPVLTRSRVPPKGRDHTWLMTIPLGVVAVAGLAFWLYVSAHPAKPLVNQSVMSMPPPAAATAGG